MKLLVVDDESLARERLQSMLAAMPEVDEVQEANNAFAALALIKSSRFDGVFLDIWMPGQSGMDLVQNETLPPVVFVTAYEEFATEAFSVGVVDYLLKPFCQDRLQKAVERLRAQSARDGARGNNARLVVNARGQRHLFLAADISRFYSAQQYSAFRHQEREFFLDESLDKLEERYAAAGFFRLHRNELVNLARIRSLVRTETGVEVHLLDGQVAHGSRRKMRLLRQLIASSEANVTAPHEIRDALQ